MSSQPTKAVSPEGETYNTSGVGAASGNGNSLLCVDPDPPGLESSITDDFVSIRINRFTDASAAAFAEKAAKAQSTGQPVLPVTICSWGGLIAAGLQMKAAIDRSEIPVLTYTPDRAMSCGFFLLASGTPGYRFVDPNATTMDHQALYGLGGKDAEVENQHEHHREDLDRFYRLLDEACGQEPGFFKQRWEDLNNLNDYLLPDETVEIGAADQVGRPTIKATPSINWTIQR